MQIDCLLRRRRSASRLSILSEKAALTTATRAPAMTSGKGAAVILRILAGTAINWRTILGLDQECNAFDNVRCV